MQSRAEPSSYVQVCELAQGGMGTVSLAYRKEGRFRRLHAVKRLHAHLQTDPDVRAMFLDEARIAGLLAHPNVVSVIDVGEDASGPYLVMDFIEGSDLGRLISSASARGEPIPMQVCFRIAIAIAHGLHAAHELVDHDGAPLALVHRDLSPQNVLVGYDGAVRITDFGIAKALGRSARTSTGVLKGKIAYMSPEQLRFEPPDRRSDLFALGVVLYEMLIGKRLYRSEDAAEGARRILNEPPPDVGELRPDVPASVVELLFRLLAKERERRPETAGVVATRLEGALAELLVEEDSIEVGPYVRDLFGDQPDVRRAELSRAMQEAERRSSPYGGGVELTPTPIAVRRMGTGRRWGMPVAVGVAIAVGVVLGLVGMQWMRNDDAPERAERDVAAAHDVPAAERPTEQHATATSPPDEPPVAAEPQSAGEETAEEPTEEAPAASRPSRARTHRSRRTAMTASAMQGLERWSW